MIGYQADMGQQYWGCLYDESRRRKVLAQADLDLLKRIVKKDDWNTYEIHCEGKRVILKINGEVTVDYTEPDDSIEQEGLIGLQIHSGAPSEAWYKDITIEELAHPSEIISIWMDLAPGETEKRHGKARPPQEADPTITRVEGITHPTMEVFTPEDKGNGAAVVILPGGGFRYVVPNLEGSEAGAILNQLGITVFVLNYRTTSEGPAGAWRRPLQDSQRAIRYVRANAARWNLDQNKVGLLAFSAGGQVGAIHIGDLGDAYEPSDAIDQRSARPDFAMLVYPWRLADAKTNELMPEIQMSDKAPPTFLVHTHDDNSSSVGTALVYLGLKKHNVSAELHVYQNGGHGYGVRARPNSNIGTWSDRAVDWLRTRGLGEIPESSSH
jgi:acetyl esterase/lipase